MSGIRGGWLRCATSFVVRGQFLSKVAELLNGSEDLLGEIDEHMMRGLFERWRGHGKCIQVSG